MSKVTVEMDEESLYVLRHLVRDSTHLFTPSFAEELGAALRAAKPAGEVWEVVDDFQESDEDGVLLTINDQSDTLDGESGFCLILETIRGEHKVLGYDLPDDIRLCRRRTEGA